MFRWRKTLIPSNINTGPFQPYQSAMLAALEATDQELEAKALEAITKELGAKKKLEACLHFSQTVKRAQFSEFILLALSGMLQVQGS